MLAFIVINAKYFLMNATAIKLNLVGSFGLITITLSYQSCLKYQNTYNCPIKLPGCLKKVEKGVQILLLEGADYQNQSKYLVYTTKAASTKILPNYQ